MTLFDASDVILEAQCTVLHEDPDHKDESYVTVFGVVEFEKVSKPARVLGKIHSRFDRSDLDAEVFKANRPFSLYQWFNITSYTGFSLRQHSESSADACNCFVLQLARPNSKWQRFSSIASLSRAGRREGASSKLAVRAAMCLADLSRDVSLGDVASSCPELLPVAGIIRSSAEILTATKVFRGETSDTTELNDPLGIWVCGGSGTGKSSFVRDIFEVIEQRCPGSTYFATGGRTGGSIKGFMRVVRAIVSTNSPSRR